MVEPLSLKARAGVGGGGAAGSIQCEISRTWAVKKTQRGIYTGGKVALLVPPPSTTTDRGGQEVEEEEELVATLYGSDVVLSSVKNGQVVAVISCGQGEGKEEIVAFAAHPAGHEIATASRNLMLRYWNWRGTPTTASSSSSSSPAFSPRCTRSYKAHETPVLSLEYDRTGTLLATGGSDRAVKVWDVPGGFCTHNFKGHTGIVTLVRFHPDSARRELLFSASDDCTVRVWSLARGGACVQVLTNHMSAVTGLGLSQDGNTLLTAGRDQIVSVWDVKDTSSSSSSSDAVVLLESLPVYEVVEGLVVLDADEAQAMGRGVWDGSEYGGRVTDAEQDALHQDRHTKKTKKRALGSDATAAAAEGQPPRREGAFALAGAKGKVRVFHYKPKPDPFAKGLSIHCVAEQHGPEVYPRGYAGLLKGGCAHPTHLLAVTTDHNLHWVRGGTLGRDRVLVGYNDQIIDVKYLGPDKVVVASNSPQVRVFRLGDMSCEAVLEGQHTETVLAVDVSPNGQWILTGSKDRAVCLWQLHQNEEGGERSLLTGTCARRYEGHTDAVSAVALTRRTAGYQQLAAGVSGGTSLAFSAGADRTLKRWVLVPRETAAAAAKKKQQQQQKAEEEQDGLPFPPPVTTEASASVLAHDKDINALAVAPNDALLASASQDKTVKLWDTKTLSLLGVLKGHKRGVWSVEFSPLDRCVVTGSGDRTVRLWSLTDHTCLKSLEGHSASVLSATFLRNGLQVLSAGADGLLKLWTVRTQECEATMDGHEERVWALALSPDGKQVVTGGGDSVLNVWQDVTAAEEEEALKAAEVLVQKEQALHNSVSRKDYYQAVRLALELGRPFRLFKVLQEVLESGAGTTALDPYVKEWSDADIGQVLGYVREWNTNAKNAAVAQSIVQALFRLVPHARLKKCCAAQPSVLAGLLAYTERHLARADRLLQSSFLVDYMLTSMQLLFPTDEDEGGGGGSRRLGPIRNLPPATPAATAINGRRKGKKDEEEAEVESESSSSSSSSESEKEEEEEVENAPVAPPPQKKTKAAAAAPVASKPKAKGKGKQGTKAPAPPPPPAAKKKAATKSTSTTTTEKKKTIPKKRAAASSAPAPVASPPRRRSQRAAKGTEE